MKYIEDKTTNMYACSIAIIHSKNVTQKIIANGGIANNMYIEELVKIAQEKPNKIFNKVCPDIILANKRIDRLKTLDVYDIISSIIKATDIAKGTPPGKKTFANFNLLYLRPTKVELKKTIRAKKKLIAKKLVTVELYGTIPKLFENNINENTVIKKQKKICFLKAILLCNIFLNSYIAAYIEYLIVTPESNFIPFNT